MWPPPAAARAAPPALLPYERSAKRQFTEEVCKAGEEGVWRVANLLNSSRS